MTPSRRLAALLVAALLGTAACGPVPEVSSSPVPSAPATPALTTPPPSAIPFAPVAWPVSGTACGPDGTASRLARIEAPDPKTVVFTLCGPDGAFLARLAHPAMGVVNAAELARITANPGAARDLAGRGAYRVVRWGVDNVELARIGGPSTSAVEPTVIIRWAADAGARTAALVNASVDGIDAPSAEGLSTAALTPSLAVVPRVLLATAVLGFGRGAPFSDARVRRAVAMGIDTAGLAASFPAGSAAADHLVPCDVPYGCAGGAYRGFNGPAATAALQGVGFDFTARYTLTVPDAPIPGLPDPSGAAAALVAQFAANLGLTATVETVPAADFRAAVDGGTVTGLYLDGIAATLADPSAFYGPLLLDHPAGLPAQRAGAAIASLASAELNSDPSVRAAAYAAAATALRDSVPVAPLVHPGESAVFRADVKGAATSPLGADPLGSMTAGDRGQMVFEQASAPGGGWCGMQASAAGFRLCALVTDGLYGYAAGSLDPTPRLATACTPNADATVWTCRLRSAQTGDGLALDAADVVATFRAMADPSDPVHEALGNAAFTVWDQLFGADSGAHPVPTPTPSPSPSPSGSASASPGTPSTTPGTSASPGTASGSPDASAR